MTPFVLPRGTIVKHGTTANRLRSILENGIRPGAAREQLRRRDESAPEIGHGVYVGELMAYFGATLSFMSLASRFAPSGVARPPSAEDVAPPVVLEIALKEDCPLWADEDFIWAPVADLTPARLQADAPHVWSVFRSGALVRERGVPPDWISRFEFPRLVIAARTTPGELQQFRRDARLMVWSHVQSWKKLPLDACVTGFVEQHALPPGSRPGFSGALPFSAAGIEELFGSPVFASPETAFAYLRNLHNAFIEGCRQAGVGGVVPSVIAAR